MIEERLIFERYKFIEKKKRYIKGGRNESIIWVLNKKKKDSIFTFKQVLSMLIRLSTTNNIKYKEYKPFVRPTKVPFLIADIKKFKKETGWKPNLNIEDILNDTLNHWRHKLDNNEI